MQTCLENFSLLLSRLLSRILLSRIKSNVEEMSTVVKMPTAPSPPASPERIEPPPRSQEALAKPYLINKAFRATKCRGPKKECPGAGNMIAKGELRFGTRAEVDGRDSVFWRHIGCVTERLLTNKNITADSLPDYIDFCIDDGTKMSVTAEEARAAENTLRALLGAAPLSDTAASAITSAASVERKEGEEKVEERAEQQKKKQKTTE